MATNKIFYGIMLGSNVIVSSIIGAATFEADKDWCAKFTGSMDVDISGVSSSPVGKTLSWVGVSLPNQIKCPIRYVLNGVTVAQQSAESIQINVNREHALSKLHIPAISSFKIETDMSYVGNIESSSSGGELVFPMGDESDKQNIEIDIPCWLKTVKIPFSLRFDSTQLKAAFEVDANAASGAYGQEVSSFFGSSNSGEPAVISGKMIYGSAHEVGTFKINLDSWSFYRKGHELAAARSEESLVVPEHIGEVAVPEISPEQEEYLHQHFGEGNAHEALHHVVAFAHTLKRIADVHGDHQDTHSLNSSSDYDTLSGSDNEGE